jgi:hypothetical protein
VFTLILFLPLTILAGATLKHAMLEVAFIVMLYMACGPVVGVPQLVRLTAEDFDTYHHQKLIGNSATVEASKSGILPYRERVGAFWRMAAIAAPIAFLFWANVMWGFNDQGPGLLFVLDLALAPIGIAIITENIRLLRDSRIVFVEGRVIKSSQSSGGSAVLYLTCNEHKFETHSRIWGGILDGQPYRLWYSAVNDRIIAYELIGATTGKAGHAHLL